MFSRVWAQSAMLTPFSVHSFSRLYRFTARCQNFWFFNIWQSGFFQVSADVITSHKVKVLENFCKKMKCTSFIMLHSASDISCLFDCNISEEKYVQN